MVENEDEENVGRLDDEEWLSGLKPSNEATREQKNQLTSLKMVVKVNCHHSGEFKKVNGELDYVNGQVEVLEICSVTIFEDVIVKMLHKIQMGKMWYKLPYEDFVDRKPLWENIDVNKKKMRAAGCWFGEFDFIIEKVPEEEVIGIRGNSMTTDVLGLATTGISKKAVSSEVDVAQIGLSEKAIEVSHEAAEEVVAELANERDHEVDAEVVGQVVLEEEEEATDNSEDEDYDGNAEDGYEEESEDEELPFQDIDDESSNDEEVVEEDLDVFQHENL